MDTSERVTIDFEVFAVRVLSTGPDAITVQRIPAPTRRTRHRRKVPSIAKLRCTACGDEGTLRDPRLATRAAAIHARTAHDGARARVRSVTGLDA